MKSPTTITMTEKSPTKYCFMCKTKTKGRVYPKYHFQNCMLIPLYYCMICWAFAGKPKPLKYKDLTSL